MIIMIIPDHIPGKVQLSLTYHMLYPHNLVSNVQQLVDQYLLSGKHQETFLKGNKKSISLPFGIGLGQQGVGGKSTH